MIYLLVSALSLTNLSVAKRREGPEGPSPIADGQDGDQFKILRIAYCSFRIAIVALVGSCEQLYLLASKAA
ncbi:hypothetical protein D1872_345870 [compost metagenome]